MFVNRPWSQGRSLLNLPETLAWLHDEWAPSRAFGAPLAFESVSVSASTELPAQVAVFQAASVLVYPHGATMAHAQFLPRNSAVLEVIPWKNVTEPHGWLLVRLRGYRHVERRGVEGGVGCGGGAQVFREEWQPGGWALHQSPPDGRPASMPRRPLLAQSIKRQMELDTLDVGLLVNDERANLVLNWHVRAVSMGKGLLGIVLMIGA